MNILRLTHFCVQEVYRFQKSSQNDFYKILICGDEVSVINCVDQLQRLLGDGIMNRLIVASDKLSPLLEKYADNWNLKIINLGEAGVEGSLIEWVQEQEEDPIRIAIDFTPTLRRLHRISRVLDWNSLVIIREEGLGWRSLFPALFASFEESGTELVNFDRCSDDMEESAVDDAAERVMGRLRV